MSISTRPVLVLYRDSGIANLVSQALTTFFDVCPFLAGSNAEAMKLLKKHRPELCIVEDDYDLETIKLLKGDPLSSNAPVLLLTARIEEKVKAALAGYDAVLGMPFDLDQLLEMVRKLIPEVNDTLDGTMQLE